MENQKILRKKKRELGASLVEYGLLVALIAVISVFTVKGLGNKLEFVFLDAKDAIGTGSGNICSGPNPGPPCP